MFVSKSECERIEEEQGQLLLDPKTMPHIYDIYYTGKRTITSGDFAFIQSTPEILARKDDWLQFMTTGSFVYHNKEYKKIYEFLVHGAKNNCSPLSWMNHFVCIIPETDSDCPYVCISDETLEFLKSIYWEIDENKHVLFHKGNKVMDLGKVMKDNEETIAQLNIYYKQVIVPMATILNSYYVENTWDHMPTFDDFENSDRGI